ncbi:response regulator [Salinimicrobium sp. MT39]|uniref:Response regulator n=1 Tax=Salinimicrobium profundisediminis TaxID=2994553 RepID=A0A9X3I0J5_9FLAO|nr:response regulator [Salinimicrobium profundisediminis]MCX2837619.1 response regulator [Salinimicrobium profundisediminis]
MKKPRQYIIVDDDRTNNLICEYAVKGYDPGAKVISFTNPEAALIHIEKELKAEGQVPTVLFVDVNMPAMSGWEFLEELEKLDHGIKQKFTIYILSSSTEDFNEEREQFPYVADFLSKPLSKTSLEQIQP